LLKFLESEKRVVEGAPTGLGSW